MVLSTSRDLWQSAWQEVAALEGAFTQTSQSRAVWTKQHRVLPREKNQQFWQSPAPPWQRSKSRSTYCEAAAHHYNAGGLSLGREENICQNKLAKCPALRFPKISRRQVDFPYESTHRITPPFYCLFFTHIGTQKNYVRNDLQGEK